MNRFLKTTLLLLFAVMCGYGVATAQTVIVVTPANGGTPEKISLDLIKKITFADDNMIVTPNDETTRIWSFVMPETKTITFEGDGINAIGNPMADASALKLVYSGGLLGATGLAPGACAKAAVYDISGRTVITAAHWDGTPISVASLPAGVYVFKVNSQTIKFTK